MSTLLLVRHGQATPFEAHTDRLTELGVRQATALAQLWSRAGVDADEVRTGTLERQQRTAAVVAEHMATDRRPWPPPMVDAGFDEYDGDGIFGTLARRLAEDDARVHELVRRAERARGTAEQNRRFQHMVEYVADHWRRGAVTDPLVETWPEFCGRVDAALDRVLDDGRGRRVVVFTSGGVIGRVLQRVLKAPDETALALNWRVKNASLSRLTFGGGRISVDSFNETAHLQAAGLDSYR